MKNELLIICALLLFSSRLETVIIEVENATDSTIFCTIQEWHYPDIDYFNTFGFFLDIGSPRSANSIKIFPKEVKSMSLNEFNVILLYAADDASFPLNKQIVRERDQWDKDIFYKILANGEIREKNLFLSSRQVSKVS